MHDGFADPDDNEGGIGGTGGRVYITEAVATAGQVFDYSCGLGGAAGEGGATGRDGKAGTTGTDTIFGVYNSVYGVRYTVGLMDIQSGAVYAQKGGDYGYLVEGLNGSGGAGGKQGKNGKRVTVVNPETGESYTKVKARPQAGTDGLPGKDGCIIVEW